MYVKACCVTGHRDIPYSQIERVYAALQREVESAIADGYTDFISGFARGIDQYFAGIVAQYKANNPAIRLIAAIPFRKREEELMSLVHTKSLLNMCDEIHVLQEEYHLSAYFRRNRFMVEHSDRVIAVYDGRTKGGTAATVQYANKLKKDVRTILMEPHT